LQIYSPLKIIKIELIRNNSVVNKKQINRKETELDFIDLETFDNISLKHTQEKERFIFYYLRIFLSKDNMAWSSPIWIVKRE
ncbi:MAG: hypothetical protein ACTSQJ_15090, partial [Promethearchaeota archaeon]